MLVVDDDRALRESVCRALLLEGYEAVGAADGAMALDQVDRAAPDLIILDLGLPYLSGFTVCEVLRARNDRTPILVLTARSMVSDRVRGLDAGADDFMTKPFVLDELFARVRALLRRTRDFGPPADVGPGQQSPDGPLELADLTIDVAARRVWRGEREVELSKTEFDLLELLVRNAGIVLDRSTIYDRIWGYDFGPDSKNLTVYMGYLRSKTESEGETRLLHTVRGVGYVARDQ
ncbi:MAG: response regulator transcription factor [Actinomycetes bacterium]